MSELPIKSPVKGQDFDISGGFLDHWTKNYHKTNDFVNKIWRLFQFYKFLILIRIIWFFTLDKSVNKTDRIHVYLGSFSNYMGGPPRYTEFVAISWTLSELIFYQYCICRPRSDFSWLKIFVFLNQTKIEDLGYYITPRSVGLSEDKCLKLKKRARIAFTMASQYISQILGGFMFIIGVIFYVNYELRDFLIFGIPWVIAWGIWTHVGCIIVYWMPAYFYVFCYYIKLLLVTVNENLKTFNKNYRRIQRRHRDEIMVGILRDHNQICHMIEKGNKYWRIYLTITFGLYTAIICFLLFFLVIATVPWYTYLQYGVIFSGHSILLLIITYSAAIVWQETNETFRLLIASRNIPLSIGVKIKWMTYLEKTKVNRQGFKLITGQLLSTETFQEVIENLVKYFLLVIENKSY